MSPGAGTVLHQVKECLGVVIQINTPVLGNGSDRQLRLPGCSQLAGQDHVEFRAKLSGQHSSGDDAAAGDGHNDVDVGATTSIDALTVIFGNRPDNCFGC
jgi:hypothetical protein